MVTRVTSKSHLHDLPLPLREPRDLAGGGSLPPGRQLVQILGQLQSSITLSHPPAAVIGFPMKSTAPAFMAPTAGKPEASRLLVIMIAGS